MGRMLNAALAGAASAAIVVMTPLAAYAAAAGAGTLVSPSGQSTTSGRVFRDAVPSTCGVPKAFPGTSGAGPRAYTSHTLTNAGPAQCVTITVNSSNCTSGNPNVFPVLYNGTFNPGALGTNYLADTGSSIGSVGSSSLSLAVNLAAGQTVTLVLQDVNGTPDTCDYTYSSAELSPPTSIPTLGEWAMIAMTALLAACGMMLVYRRNRADGLI